MNQQVHAAAVCELVGSVCGLCRPDGQFGEPVSCTHEASWMGFFSWAKTCDLYRQTTIGAGSAVLYRQLYRQIISDASGMFWTALEVIFERP